MASVSKEKSGGFRVQFSGADRKRRTLRLGKCSRQHADTVAARVESLIAAQILGMTPDQDTLRWVAGLQDKMRNRLIRCQLIAGASIPKTTKKVSLKDYLQGYISQRKSSMKPATVLVWQTTTDSIIKSIDVGLHQLNASHGRKWMDDMRAAGLKPTTIYKRLQFAKQFLNHAVDSKVLIENPWASIKLSRPKVASNVEVDRQTIYKLMATIDSKWKAIVALARYGGLRCPSEVLSIKWEHIDWDKSSMQIPSPKTEHLSGGESRLCPLFRDLRAVLEPIRRDEGYVVDMPELRSRSDTADGWASANLRSLLLDRMKAAGIKPWPRLFHSMRASRQTELQREFGLAAACAWLGNTDIVAKQHYLLVTSDDWKKAT